MCLKKVLLSLNKLYSYHTLPDKTIFVLTKSILNSEKIITLGKLMWQIDNIRLI